MIGIKAIASYIPDLRESNYDKKEQFSIDDAFIENKIGVKSKARKAEGEETSDLCCRAYEPLATKMDLSIEDIDCLIVCTQNPDGNGLPHTSAIVHGKLGCADHVAAFDISLGCSGYVYGLSVATSFMNANKLKNGLLFTSDPYSKIINPDDKNTSLLFGDAATVTLLTEDPIYTLQDASFGTRGNKYEALQRIDDHLYMNGRAVFDFSMTTVPPQIKQVVTASGHNLDDMDLFVIHQGSKFIIDVMSRRLKIAPEKVPTNLAEVGNTVSSSIPLLLESYLNTPNLHNILISGFGVGLSWASAILTKVTDTKETHNGRNEK